jgi:hypothetical protein
MQQQKTQSRKKKQNARPRSFLLAFAAAGRLSFKRRNDWLPCIALLDMLRVAIPSRVRWTVAILGAALVAQLLAPVRAVASCGDYLTMHSHQGVAVLPRDRLPGWLKSEIPEVDDLPMLIAIGPLNAVALHSHRAVDSVPCSRCPANTGLPGQPPCQGPWCQSSPGPLTPLATPVERLRDQAALCVDLQILGDSEPVPHGKVRDRVQRIHHVSPRYHPPRSA